MKTILCILLAVGFKFSVVGQQRILYDSIFLQKSHNQKTAAYITLGTGTVSLVAGVVVLSNEKPGLDRVNWKNVLGGSALIAAGVVCITTSVVLFSASRRNERNAYDPDITLNMNKPIEIAGLRNQFFPYSAGVSIRIR
ncbi:MAG TPA: hypothetical protein VHM26_04870 [Chitinophagaceae bacterium]|jgi:hypothetical protein|nr:hypothetical protein [Chitinophagaceae bacterium]